MTDIELGVPARRSRFATKLLAAQRSLGVVVRDGFNPHGKHKYVSADGMVHACRDALNEAGLAPCGRTRLDERESAPAPVLIYELDVLDPETGHSESFGAECYALERKGMPWDKAVGAAISYAKKYAYQDALGAHRGDEDPDAKDDTKHEPIDASAVKADLAFYADRLGRETCRDVVGDLRGQPPAMLVAAVEKLKAHHEQTRKA